MATNMVCTVENILGKVSCSLGIQKPGHPPYPNPLQYSESSERSTIVLIPWTKKCTLNGNGGYILDEIFLVLR